MQHSHAAPRLPHLARKPNYDFDKRRKELDRKATRDKKLEERRLRRLQEPQDGVADTDIATDATAVASEEPLAAETDGNLA